MTALLEGDSLGPSERAVLRHLLAGPSFGRGMAQSIDSMQLMWRRNGVTVYDDRTIKKSVKALLEEHGVPIGSCRIPGQNGYYIIVSDNDAREAERPLRNEIFSLFRRISVISPKSSFVRHLNGQMDMLKEKE